MLRTCATESARPVASPILLAPVILRIFLLVVADIVDCDSPCETIDSTSLNATNAIAYFERGS